MWRKVDSPRWSQLFADLEVHAWALAAADEREEIAERTRIEAGRLALTDRLRPAAGQMLDVRCLGAGPLRGRLDRIGVDWLLLAEPPGGALVPIAAVTAVAGLGRRSRLAGGELDRRLGLRSVLRGLVRDRAALRLTLVDGTPLAGTADRVGADFLEVAEHPMDEHRHADSVRRVWTLPLARIAVIRRPAT